MIAGDKNKRYRENNARNRTWGKFTWTTASRLPHVYNFSREIDCNIWDMGVVLHDGETNSGVRVSGAFVTNVQLIGNANVWLRNLRHFRKSGKSFGRKKRNETKRREFFSPDEEWKSKTRLSKIPRVTEQTRTINPLRLRPGKQSLAKQIAAINNAQFKTIYVVM